MELAEDDWLIAMPTASAPNSASADGSSRAGSAGPVGLPPAPELIKAEPRAAGALKQQRSAKLTPQESQKLRRARKKQWVVALEMEARVKAEELERLLQENSLLHSKSRVLQAVVDDRVEHLSLLQQLNAMSLCSTSSKPKAKVSTKDAVAAVSSSGGNTGMTLFGLVDTQSDAQSLLLPIKENGSNTGSPCISSASSEDGIARGMESYGQHSAYNSGYNYNNASTSGHMAVHTSTGHGNAFDSMDQCPAQPMAHPNSSDHSQAAPSTSYGANSTDAAAVGMNYNSSSQGNGGSSPVAVAAMRALAPCPIEGARAQLADALPRLSAWLQQEGSDGQLLPHAAAQVTSAVGDLLGLMRGLEALDPLAYRQLLASNLETGAEEAPPQKARFWRRVAAAMRLSASQCRDLGLCADVYAANMAKIVEERRMLLGELRAQEGSNSTAFIAAPAQTQTQQGVESVLADNVPAAAGAYASSATFGSEAGFSGGGFADGGVPGGSGFSGAPLMPSSSGMSDGSGLNSDDDLLAWLDDAIGGDVSLNPTLDAGASSQRVLENWGLDDVDMPMSWAATRTQRGFGEGGKRVSRSAMAPKCFSFGGHAGSYMELLPLTERIDRNLMQEYSQTAMCDGAFSRLVDRVQLARALVAAWPYAPSALDILAGVQQL